MSRIGASLQSVLIREISNNRSEISDLSRQLASGKKAESYGGLGSDRTMALSLRAEKSQIEGFRDTITMAQTRVKVMDTVVGQMREQSTQMRSQLLVAGFEVLGNGQTQTQVQARSRLAEAVDLLNTDVAGRQLFAGAKTDETPVRPPAELLDGAGSKAGFRQIMDERRQADLGADGKGRLVTSASGPANVTLSEDAASPFGFKLASARSELSGASFTEPAGSPSSLSVDFVAPLPDDGQKLFITLDMPDGTQTELALTARTSGDLKEGEFLVGADGAATATSFEAALSTLLIKEADTTLRPASMQAAADDFFVSGDAAAQRVDGPPFDSATGLRDASATDTIDWYLGDKSSTPPRESSLARVGENRLIPYGARADETPFSSMIKQFAIMSSATFDQDNPNDSDRYSEMRDRVSGNLGDSVRDQSIDRIVGELAIAQNALGEADKSFETKDNMLTDFLGDIETTDLNETAAKLLSMQTQLQASYQVTSMLSKLSLTNFL